METLAADLATMIRTPLHAGHIAAMREVGTIVDYAPGEVLQALGEPVDKFHYLLSGEVEAIDPRTGEPVRQGYAGAGAVLWRDQLSIRRQGDAGGPRGRVVAGAVCPAR